MTDIDYDLCVIGGGINGAGIARDAAGRGLSVLLLEAEDLAGGTSSASTKLIHGGLRYLEFFEFKLVREALKEREVLLSLAPHLVRPMEFILPHTPQQRPAWMVRIGLFLYDHLARRDRLKGSKAVSLSGLGFKAAYEKGFRYSDCWADDSRLVALNAMDAARKGAKILTRTTCTKLLPQSDHWEVCLRGASDQKDRTVTASMVINAAGPWVSKVLEGSGLSGRHVPHVRLVKGSHIITRRLYDGEQAYILQQPDGRIVFVIPYEGEFTLIGTTEEDYAGDPRAAMISEEEVAYLVEAYNRFFEKGIKRDDVMWSYSGVRPLYDEGDADARVSARSVTRNFKFHVHDESKAPMISVFGGKLTTYRILAEQVMDKILHLDSRYAPPWTADKPLPGGELHAPDFDAFLQRQAQQYPWLDEGVLRRYARNYGSRMDVFLEDAKRIEDLGRHFGDGVYEAEIVYLLRAEFAQTAEDILFRRSKLGLHVADETAATIVAFLKDYQKKEA